MNLGRPDGGDISRLSAEVVRREVSTKTAIRADPFLVPRRRCLKAVEMAHSLTSRPTSVEARK